MPESVVHLFKMVDVDHQQAKRQPLAFPFAQEAIHHAAIV